MVSKEASSRNCDAQRLDVFLKTIRISDRGHEKGRRRKAAVLLSNLRLATLRIAQHARFVVGSETRKGRVDLADKNLDRIISTSLVAALITTTSARRNPATGSRRVPAATFDFPPEVGFGQ